MLPVELLLPYLSAKRGRPTNELVAIMGAMLLQQMHDLTDEETAEQFAFNIKLHYALDISNNSDNTAYVCPKNIRSIRSIMTKYGIYDNVFEVAGYKLNNVFDVDHSLQHTDSVHIFFNMKYLGRIGIFTTAIRNFLINLKRQHKTEFKALDPSLRERYLKKAEESSFSMVSRPV